MASSRCASTAATWSVMSQAGLTGALQGAKKGFGAFRV